MFRRKGRRRKQIPQMDVDMEQVGERGGVPLLRLWFFCGGMASQTVVDGLAMIPLSLWLEERIAGKEWPTGFDIAGLNDAGLPRVTRVVIPNRIVAERMYGVVSRAALRTAHALLIAGSGEAVDDGEDDDG